MNPRDAPSTQQPSKRGRKPGPLSRSARETQRKLNHSIIEKARRTKINEALATLKELVPSDFGPPRPITTSPEEEETDEDDYEDSKKKAKVKKPEKKEEKEFKLEILVRTVAFTRHLLDRVAVLEAAQSNSRKRRSSTDEDDHDHRRKKGNWLHAGDDKPALQSLSPTETPSPALQPLPPAPSHLPPISSWLPNIDPCLLPSPCEPSQLPSPPSSTTFTPIQSFQLPPTLSLGPIATASSLKITHCSPLSTSRTPEEESAATLLLHISASPPTFRSTSSANEAHPSPRQSTVPEGSSDLVNVQTPSSLLGLPSNF